jgi:hypothetical protein
VDEGYMKKAISIYAGVLFTLVMVQTGMASVQLDLTNDTENIVFLDGYDDGLECDLIQKSGTGIDVIPIGLTNTGNTRITEGTLQFTGSQVILQDVIAATTTQGSGQGASGSITGNTLIVGSDDSASQVWAKSISVGTLTIGRGSKVTIKPISSGPVVPEPTSLLVWSFISAMAFLLPYFLRRR